MKFLIVFAAVIVVVLANKDDQTVRFDIDNIGPEGYKFAWVLFFFLHLNGGLTVSHLSCLSYETSGGITHEETGVVNNLGAENEAISVRGSYSFVADDGQTYTVNFVADENGYQPEGAHLPKAE